MVLLESLPAILLAETGAALCQAAQPDAGVQDQAVEATPGPIPWLGQLHTTCIRPTGFGT